MLGSNQIFSSKKIHDAGFEDVLSLHDEVRRVVQSFEPPV
jgi:hypothetical protein